MQPQTDASRPLQRSLAHYTAMAIEALHVENTCLRARVAELEALLCVANVPHEDNEVINAERCMYTFGGQN